MKTSLIGTGRMGEGLAQVLSAASGDLLWGSRTPEKAVKAIRERGLGGVRAVDTETALSADIIFHALWFRDAIPWAKRYEEKLAGKILVDITNPFTEDFNDFTTEWGTSAAEEMQRALPRTVVVGAFKNTFFKVLDKPLHEGLASDVFVTSDDEEAKRNVMEILQGIPFRVLDGGGLKNNRTIERMTLFEREMALRCGNYPYVSWRLFGLHDEFRDNENRWGD